MINISDKKGFGIIEIVVTLGIVAVIVLAVGKSLSSVHRLYQASEFKTQALIYAQEPIEIISGLKNDIFACSCTFHSCTATTCTRGSDGQSCDPIGIYTSCWTRYPIYLAGYNRFYLQKSGSLWQLLSLAPGSFESITANPNFSREIIIENLNRDSANAAGTPDFNTKKVTVTVYWTERGNPKNISLSTIFTAWENL